MNCRIPVMNVHVIEFLQLITHYLECYCLHIECKSISAMIILFEQMSDINILLCISEKKLKNELCKMQQENAGITCVLKCNQDELYILRNATINFL